MNTFMIFFGCVVLASLVFCEDKEEPSELEKCGSELEKLYDKVCDEKDIGGKKLTAIRKICFTYPPKVMKHKEIVDIMDKCNTEEQVCDKKKMADVSTLTSTYCHRTDELPNHSVDRPSSRKHPKSTERRPRRKSWKKRRYRKCLPILRKKLQLLAMKHS